MPFSVSAIPFSCTVQYLSIHRLIKKESIKTYLENDDAFNWNYGIALAAVRRYDEALEALQRLSDESFKAELTYVTWLAKCYIGIGAIDKAWKCLDTEDQETVYEVLQLIANECYKLGGGKFLYSAKAFKVLYDIDKFPDYLNGLIGACVGFFRHCVAQKQCRTLTSDDADTLPEIVEMLETSGSPKCNRYCKTIQTWRAQNV